MVNDAESDMLQEEADWDSGDIDQALSSIHGIEPLEGDIEYLEMEALEE
ncbi:jg22554, partial [Pararge aegeria aegeria]